MRREAEERREIHQLEQGKEPPRCQDGAGESDYIVVIYRPKAYEYSRGLKC